MNYVSKSIRMIILSCLGLFFVVACNVGSTASSNTNSNNNINWLPEDIAFTSVNGNQYAYVTDFRGLVYQCLVNNTGQFVSCIANNVSTDEARAYGIAIATTNSRQYSYVVKSNGNAYRCSLNPTSGLFDTCIINNGGIESTNWEPVGINLTTVNSIQYAYIADLTGNIYQCTLNERGAFNSCSITNGGVESSTWKPGEISFATVNSIQYAYIADNDGHVYQCGINRDGTLRDCTIADGGVTSWEPFGIAFSTINAIQYGYVADFLGNIYQCTLDETGKFDICAPSNGGMIWAPKNITTATFNSVPYVYIPNGTNTNDHVYQCNLADAGTLNNCIITP